MSIETFARMIEKRSQAEALYWAGVLIWAGLVFGAASLGSLPQIGAASAWSWVFLGAGLYGTTLNLIGSAMPGPVTTTWDYIWSGFWMFLGLSGFFAIDFFWPLFLLLLGAIVLVNAGKQS